MFRRCFLPPLPEHDLAADLLARAADALLVGDLHQASHYLRNSDLTALEEFRHRIAGRIDPDIHRQSHLPVFIPSPPSGPRMPSSAVSRQVLARDGYRCRFCGSKVIVKEARRAFVKALPAIVRWNGTNKGCHFGLAVLAASIDHVVPFQRGGSSEDLKNLVTTCNPCQFGRAHWLLDEVELSDPLNYPPILDGWDGLSRLRNLKLNGFDWH